LPPNSTPPNRRWARELRERSRKKWGILSEKIDEQIKATRRFIKELNEKPPEESSDETE
jgi:hypothetical protein